MLHAGNNFVSPRVGLGRKKPERAKKQNSNKQWKTKEELNLLNVEIM